MNPWNFLKPDDCVEIIAPSSGQDLERLELSKNLLVSWGLIPKVSADIFGDDLIYANSDEKRFENLKEALYAEDSQAIWCLRGGSGATRLIQRLMVLEPPKKQKLFIGFSDITAFHTFFAQKWGWTTIHGPTLGQVAVKRITPDSIDAIKKLVFGETASVLLPLTPLNQKAAESFEIESTVVGGNLSLVQYSIGGSWQLETKDKIVFLEDVNEKAYRVAEILEHLRQAGLFEDAKAVIFGDFTFEEPQPAEEELCRKVLKRFAEELRIPVLSCPGVGHGHVNNPLPLNTAATLSLGKKATLECLVKD